MNPAQQLTIAIMLFASTACGQANTPDTSLFQIAKEFESFLAQFTHQPSDTIISDSDSVSTYRVVYSVYGLFSDPKTHFSRTFNIQSIVKDTSHIEFTSLHTLPDSLQRGFRGDPSHSIKTSLIYSLWGEPLHDSIMNVESDPSIWASSISAQAIRFTRATSSDHRIEFSARTTEISPLLGSIISDDLRYDFDDFVPPILSFQNGKYLIIDRIVHYNYIGGQTDYGSCLTYYLERVKESIVR